MADSKTTPAPAAKAPDVADPFADLLTVVTDKAQQQTGIAAKWSGPIPASVKALADAAIADGKRKEIPWRGEAHAEKFHAALAAYALSLNPPMSVYTTIPEDALGNKTAFTYRFGTKRTGRKQKAIAVNANTAE